MIHTTAIFILLLFPFLMEGCEENFPVYTSGIQNNSLSFPCLHYAVLDRKDKADLENAFGMKEVSGCPYRVELTKYEADSCNNPVVKSVGGDFNGYVRVEVKKGFISSYKVQSDYRHDVDAAYRRVLQSVASVTRQ